MSTDRIRRCLLCGKSDIEVRASDRFITVSCRTCSAILRIEFDPPDAPQLRARIDRIDEPD